MGDSNTDNTAATVYTEEQLNEMTKAEIEALATELGYSVSATDTKAEMIASFLAQQEEG